MDRSKERVFICDPVWENCDYWAGLDDSERQEYLRKLEEDRKRGKIVKFAEKVKIEDLDYFYKTSKAFKQLVDKTRC